MFALCVQSIFCFHTLKEVSDICPSKTKLCMSLSIHFWLLSEAGFLGQGNWLCCGPYLHMAAVPAEKSPAMSELLILQCHQHYTPYSSTLFLLAFSATTSISMSFQPSFCKLLVEIKIAKKSSYVSAARL